MTPRIRTNLDFTWVDWSSYDRPISFGTTELTIDIENLPLEIPPSTKPAVAVDHNFKDRIQPRLGIEVWPVKSEHFELPVRAGYVYEKSPVPDQTGNTNSVDADRYVIGLGVGVRLVEPGAVLPGDLRLDVHGAYAMLPERETLKSNPADFVGDYPGVA